MKLRISGNSVRVRLTQREVATLAQGKPVEQITEFSADSRLVTRLEPSSRVQIAAASFVGTQLALLLPLNQVRNWAQSDQVGIEANQPIDSSRSLEIHIEKDFECLHRPAEKESDAFPNPRKR
jgi:uncharacterized protein DUF7009